MLLTTDQKKKMNRGMACSIIKLCLLAGASAFNHIITTPIYFNTLLKVYCEPGSWGQLLSTYCTKIKINIQCMFYYILQMYIHHSTIYKQLIVFSDVEVSDLCRTNLRRISSWSCSFCSQQQHVGAGLPIFLCFIRVITFRQ